MSIKNMHSIIDSRIEYFSKIGFSEEEMNRRKTGSKAGKLGMEIWYNILFGEYEEARNMLTEFKEITDIQLTYDPRAQTDYYKYLGYLNLMEGNPQESINAYNQIPKEVLNDDNYHMYFLALSKRAIGQNEESKNMMISLANDNFATWQNAIVKNLAKAQIKTNI